MSPRVVRTYCRMCPALCGLLITVEDGVATKLAGDPDDPVSHGYTCPKGRKMLALTDDPSRLDRPLIRNGRGELVPASWDAVLDDLGEKLAKVRHEADPYAIAHYVGTMFDSTGRWAASRLMAGLGSPSTYTSLTIDAISKVLVTRLMASKERIWPNTDFEATTLLLLLGENMVVSHGGYSYVPDPINRLREVMRNGEVWVVDRRRTETARHGTRHLVPRSGSDYALLAHLVREILADGADEDYLARHARNVDELRHVVAPFDRDTTAALTDISPADLEELVATVRRHGRLAVITGTGVSMSATGNVADWMAYALQIVTGSIERPGGRWFNHGPTFDPSAPMTNDSPELPDPGPRTRPDIPRIAGQYPCAVLPAEIEAGHVRALLVTGGSPLTAFPQPARLAAAVDKLDVVAVWDLFRTPMVERATHVLPCPDGLERPDLRMPIHLSAVYAHYAPAAVTRRAERRSMWWSLATLGQRLGVEVLPGGSDPDQLTDDDILAMQVAGTAVDFEAIRAAARPVPFPYVERWVAKHVLPDGRWDVAPVPLVAQLRQALERPKHDLVLGNRREVHHTNSMLTAGEGGGTPLAGRVFLSPADAAHAGLADGSEIEVTSPHGSLRGTACVDDTVAPGTVVVPHGFSHPNVGELTSTDADLDPLTGMPTLVGVPVELRAVV